MLLDDLARDRQPQPRSRLAGLPTGAAAVEAREDVRQMASWGVTEVFFGGSRLAYGKPDALNILLDQMAKLRGVI